MDMIAWKRRLGRVSLGAAVAAPVVAGAVLLWYRRAYTLPPEPAVSVPHPHPNGDDTLRAAAELQVRAVDGVGSSPLRRDDPWPLAGREKLLAANAPALGRLRTALRQEFLAPPAASPATGTADRFPMHARSREFARLLDCAATTDAEEGNLPAAAGDATDAIEMGVVIPRGGGLIDSLVGIACESIGQRALWDVADRLDAQTARRAARRLEPIDARRRPVARTLSEEKRLYHLSTRAIFDGGPVRTWRSVGALLGGGEEMADAVSRMAGLPESPPPSPEQRLARWSSETCAKTWIVYDGPRMAIENADRWMDALAARSERPWSHPRPDPTLPPDLLSQILLPVFGQAEFKVVQSRANAALATTYLALRAYRLETGAYPASLGALTAAGYLTAPPIDPFSPARTLLGYRRESADRMTLWSVGPDATDDGGRPVAARNADGKPRRGYVPANATGDIVARVDTF
jgi:type II secretory pathway pseudopilin PulG